MKMNNLINHLEITKKAFPAIVSFLILCGCSENKMNNDFFAVGFLQNDSDEKLELPEGYFLNTQSLHTVIFIYHDTVFRVSDIDNRTKFGYYDLSTGKVDTLKSFVDWCDSTNLQGQLRECESEGRCYFGRPAYFLNSKNGVKNFGVFSSEDNFVQWTEHYIYMVRKIPESDFPNEIYERIYHEMNSRHWNYYMSDDYFYRDVRFEKRFIPNPRTALD